MENERPDNLYTNTLARKRGLDLSIWSLIQRCWNPVYTLRPRMLEILKEIEEMKATSALKDILPETRQSVALTSRKVRIFCHLISVTVI